MATSFKGKIGKIAYSPSFIAMTFRKGEYRNADFKMFICIDLATLCKNLVKVG